MKNGGHGVITVPHFVIFSTGRCKCWIWSTGRFAPGKIAPLICWLWVSGGGTTGPFWRLWEGEKILSPTENHSTTARLSSHYTSYCTNWAIHSNTYQFISWLSRMFISCWFGVKLTTKRNFFDFICSLQTRYALLNASGAAALTDRRNVRGLSKADCRAGRETFSHYWCLEDYELTVRTVRLKLPTGPFSLITYCTADGDTMNF